VTEYFYKECRHHGLTKHKRQPSGNIKCLICTREYKKEGRKAGAGLERRVRARRASKSRKKLYINYMKSGGCILCWYNKSTAALHLHHVKPSLKLGEVNSMVSNGTSWNRIKTEITKCVVLCANCHAEVHDGTIDLQEYGTMIGSEYECTMMDIETDLTEMEHDIDNLAGMVEELNGRLDVLTQDLEQCCPACCEEEPSWALEEA